MERTDKKDRFKQLLKEKGLEFTLEREQMFQEIQLMKAHFDADGLYERFKRKGSRIARGTVYRNLPLFLEAGVIQKSAGEGKKDFYEKTDAKGHHDHMVCLSCKKIIEYHNEKLEKIQAEIARDYRFRLVFHDHRMFGYCESCELPHNGISK